MTPFLYDVVIVGGGLVGAGLASALQTSGCRIALLEAKPADAQYHDPRLLALNHHSCQFLANLGLWSALKEHAAPIQQVHVSHQGKLGTVSLRAEEVELSALGHVIPARFIEAALQLQLQSQSNCTLYRPAVLRSLKHLPEGVELSFMTEEGEKIVRTSLLVGADGTESAVRKLLSIPTESLDYGQSALVTTTTLKHPHQNRAYERFYRKGAIAMLPLVGNQCATIWTTNNQDAAELMAMADGLFLQQLQTEFGYRLGRLSAIANRYIFPLRKAQAQRAVDPHVYLLGNAAHTLHPIAAQGLNLAIYETAALAEKIIEQSSKQAGIAQMDLEQIQTSVQKQQAISIGSSHCLSKLFIAPSLLMSSALSLGMIGLDLARPLKKRVIHSLIGRTARSPALLLGKMT